MKLEVFNGMTRVRCTLRPPGQITLGEAPRTSTACEPQVTCEDTDAVLALPCSSWNATSAGGIALHVPPLAFLIVGCPSSSSKKTTAVHRSSERRESCIGQVCVHIESEGSDRYGRQRKRFYSTTSSSICSITSSIQTSISSLASSPRRSPFLPFLLSETSSSHWVRQVFHSSMRRFL